MNTIWVCLACGKVSEDRYGNKGTTHGWDESCFMNSVQVKEDYLAWNETKDRVKEIREGGIVEDDREKEEGKGLDKLEKNLKDVFKEEKVL